MAWRDTLQSLQTELAAVRAERGRQSKLEEEARQDQREQLAEMAQSLGIAQLIQEMNSVLLAGAGQVEAYSSWDEPEPGPDRGPEADLDILRLDGPDDEEADYVSTVLTWDENGECEIAVDLGFAEDGIYLQVNEIDIRLEREALELALVEAFREELQV
jgi:hypothetical protein